MRYSEAFPSKYISSEDLDGREMRLVIARIEMEEIGRDRDRKPVLYFTKARKGMVLNKTNGRMLATAYGDDMTAWEDREVILFSMKVQFGDEIVDGIRIRIPQSAPVPKPSPPPRQEPVPEERIPSNDFSDDIPF